MSLSPRDSPLFVLQTSLAPIKQAHQVLHDFESRKEALRGIIESDLIAINEIVHTLSENQSYKWETYHDTSSYYGEKSGDKSNETRHGNGHYQYESGAEYMYNISLLI
jgi:hypothetical protein